MDKRIQEHFDEFERTQEQKQETDVKQDDVVDIQINNEQDQESENEEQQEKEVKVKDGEECSRYKALGNSHYQKGETNEALEMYELGEEVCPLDDQKSLAILYSNMSLCYDKHKDNASVIEFTSKAIKANPSYLKPYLNRAEKYVLAERYEEAVQDYDEIIKLSPKNPTYLNRKAIIVKLKDQHFEKQKNEAIDGLKGLANTVLGKFNMSLDNFKMEQGPNGGYNVQFKQ